jgi:hypothetical protein
MSVSLEGLQYSLKNLTSDLERYLLDEMEGKVYENKSLRSFVIRHLKLEYLL